MATDFDSLVTQHDPTRGHARLADLLAAGVTASAVRSAERTGRWSNPFRGVYCLDPAGSVGADLWAIHVHLGPESTFVLGSAARLLGLDGMPAHAVPEVAVPPGLERTQRSGMHLHFWDIPESQRVTARGLPATAIGRTLADIARLKPRDHAVACLDSALNKGLISTDDLPSVAAYMSRKRGCVSGRRHLLDARVGAQSPLETRVRLRAADAGLPPDALQVPIISRGGVLLGYGDAGYEMPDRRWLIVEADGRAVHERPEAVLHDRRRQNAFVGADVKVIRFTWEDTRDPAVIPGVLGPILRSAGWKPRRP